MTIGCCHGSLTRLQEAVMDYFITVPLNDQEDYFELKICFKVKQVCELKECHFFDCYTETTSLQQSRKRSFLKINKQIATIVKTCKSWGNYIWIFLTHC